MFPVISLAVSRTIYARLFEAIRDIGFPYGVGDGHSTFTLPNFTGCFLRGAGGGNAATIGVLQSDAIRNITGGVYYISETFCASGTAGGVFQRVNGYNGANTPIYNDYNEASGFNFDASRVVLTAPENRPVNHAINWFIKY